MPRRPNTRPTLIYWLLDVRPETIAAGWHSGKPFYCGKTVVRPSYRLRQHFNSAHLFPDRKISIRLRECGSEFVKLILMETVPVSGDWSRRERHWISALRYSFPDCVNSTDGGQGAPGFVHREEVRIKLSMERKGRPLKSEHRAKISAGLKRIGPEIAAKNRLRTASDETRAKIGAFHKGRAKSSEVRAKMSAVQKGRKLTDEHRMKLTEAWEQRRLRPNPLTGRKLSPEHRAKIKESWAGRKLKEKC